MPADGSTMQPQMMSQPMAPADGSTMQPQMMSQPMAGGSTLPPQGYPQAYPMQQGGYPPMQQQPYPSQGYPQAYPQYPPNYPVQQPMPQPMPQAYPQTGGYIPPVSPGLIPGPQPAPGMLVTTNPLEKLGACTQALIEQQFELLEVLSGCETKNRYNVFILQGGGKIPLFNCKEESGWCERNCCPSDSRPFTMKMNHVVGTNVMTQQDFTHPYITFQRDFKCTCLCFERPNMKGTFNETNVYFGKVQEPCSCCSPIFNVYDKDNIIKYTIVIDCCQCGYACRTSPCGKLSECTFLILEGNRTEGEAIGRITRKVRGFENLIADADTFVLDFPMRASPEEKLMLIGAVLMIDYRYYESDASDDNQQLRNRHVHHTY